MNFLKIIFLILVVTQLVVLTGCENKEIPVFTNENDNQLGLRIAEQIVLDPDRYPIIDQANYNYAYLEGIMNEILSSSEIIHNDVFDWNINIIDDPNTLQIFATPGGQIYLYSGLIFFLSNEDDLAGVLSHEIAHVDRRHIIRQLQTRFGISFLIETLNGSQPESIEQIIRTLDGFNSLTFSRDAEKEADEYAVKYLANTDFACNSSATFFQRLINAVGNVSIEGVEEYLERHLVTALESNIRIEEINEIVQDEGCDTTVGAGSITRFQSFRQSL